MLHLPLWACLGALFALPAAAQSVWVVDDTPGPGVQFSTIGDAIAAAVPGDRIEVMGGRYPRFDLDRAVTIMGRPGVLVTGLSRVLNTPGATTTVVTDLILERLAVSNCSGTVLLDSLTLVATHDAWSVGASADVRARGIRITPASATGLGLVSVSNARLQLDASLIACGPAPDGANGQRALSAGNGSFVHLTHTDLIGGDGGDYSGTPAVLGAGVGGPALWTNNSSTRSVHSTLTGGGGGLNLSLPLSDGRNAVALRACGGDHDLWATAASGGNRPSSSAPPGNMWELICGAQITGGGALPAFELNAPAGFMPGDVVRMELRGGAFSQCTITLGRIPVMVPVPGSLIPRLVLESRVANIGAMPVSGLISLPFTIPAVLDRGTLLHLQTSRVAPTGDIELSNAGTIIVR